MCFYLCEITTMQTSSVKTLFSSAALTLAAVLAAPAAHAVEYVGSSFAMPATGNSVVSFGSGDAQSFDINFGTMTRVTLVFVTFRDEIAPTMSFSSIINNFTGYNFEGMTVRLTGGAMFQAPNGSVTPTFGTLASTVVTPTQVSMGFSSGEGFALNFGNPLMASGASDWMIDFSAVESGAAFGVSVTAVPEPGTYAMLLAGLGLIGTMVRRRRQV
jgi:hypothetical protein